MDEKQNLTEVEDVAVQNDVTIVEIGLFTRIGMTLDAGADKVKTVLDDHPRIKKGAKIAGVVAGVVGTVAGALAIVGLKAASTLEEVAEEDVEDEDEDVEDDTDETEEEDAPTEE